MAALWSRFRASVGRPGAFVLVAALGFLIPTRVLAFGWPSEVARAARALRSEQPAERLRAATSLLGLPSASARSLVELALDDEEDAVRIAAAGAAVAHGYRGLGPRVSGWLKEANPALRTRALGVLALDLQAPEVPLVARALVDPDEAVRSSAARTLARAPFALGPEVSGALVSALDDTSPLVRMEAARGLGRQGGPAAVAALVARSSDPEESVRRAAVVALGVIGDAKASAALAFALADRSSAVAALAARSLGALADPSAAPPLERILLGPGFGPLELAAAEALAELDERSGWDAIVTRLGEQEAVSQLRGSFSELTDAARASVTDCLRDAGGRALLECARVAARSGLPLDVLTGRVRRGSLPTLQLLETVEETKDLELLVLCIERLTNGSPAERHAALGLLEKSAPLPPDTGRLLGEALAVPGLSSQDVARLLFLLQPSDVEPALLAGLTRASDPLVRATAAALARLAVPGGASPLRPFASASKLEARAYGRLLGRGMQRSFAEQLLLELVESRLPPGEPIFLALAGLPADLPPRSAAHLLELTQREQGARRDALLAELARQSTAAPFVRDFFRQGGVDDRRSASALFRVHAHLAALAPAALADADSWVRAHAAQAVGASAESELTTLLSRGEPGFLRTAAILGLSRVAPAEAASRVDACELLNAEELGIRMAALVLVTRARMTCAARPLEDIVLLEREPTLRELAARALRTLDPMHRALRTCRAYDPEPSVAVACGARRSEPLEAGTGAADFVEIVPSWQERPLPGCPYALWQAGGLVIGLTDRRGQAPVSGGSEARLLDPRIAL